MKISPKAKFVLLNIGAAFVVLFLIGGVVLSFLDNYTQHGESIAVPAFYDYTPAEAAEIAQASKLRVEVADSIYDENARPGTILEQYPSSGARVKEHRLIHLTINASAPEKVAFPNLRNAAFRQTLQTLESRGFKIGSISYEPSEFRNLVLDLTLKGVSIAPGAMLPKGSEVNIILGNGLGSNTSTVPDLKGKSLREAMALIHQSYMNIGTITPDASIVNKNDQLSAFVFRQSPGAGATVEAGTPVLLGITLLKNKVEQAMTDTLMATE